MPLNSSNPFLEQVMQLYSPEASSGRMPGLRNSLGENIDQIGQYLTPGLESEDRALTERVDQIEQLGSGEAAPPRKKLFNQLMRERSKSTEKFVSEKATKLQLGREINNMAVSVYGKPAFQEDEEFLRLPKSELRKIYAVWAELVARKTLEMEATPLNTAGRPEKGA